jgi:hypothetical protein
MMPKPNEFVIPLQVGSELRIRRDGQISIDNPTLELEPSDALADAVLSYCQTGDHILRLIEPLAFNPRREAGS